MRKRIFVAAAVAVLACLGAVAFTLPRSVTTSVTGGQALIGGPFSLVDQNGRGVSAEDFRGRFMLVYFGYTFCPDVCPLELQTMTAALSKLPPDVAHAVVPVFITVDPARDTVAVMHDYVAAFSPQLVGLTGSEAEIASAMKAYRVYAEKADPGATKDYLVNHSAFVYLMGPDGHYVSHFGRDTDAATMAEKIAAVIAATPVG